MNESVEHQEFEKSVRNYISLNPPKIFILTPCYGGLCHANYTSSLINTINCFNSLSIKYQIEFCCNDSLISRARNNIVAKAMSDKEMTHMMFIDSDITWAPEDILKLLMKDKNLIGGVYPLKRYDWAKLASDPGKIKEWISNKNKQDILKQFSESDFIQHKMLEYNVNFLNSSISIENNLIQVKHIASGFMMIKRQTIELMCKAFPSTKYTDDVSYLKGDQNNYAYALFDTGVHEDHYLSEDWMFCTRWIEMGGKCFIDVTINLVHSGTEHYKGSFITSLLS
jgi:hypothetical protein